MTSRTGVMLINLGTPDDTSTRSVRRYLKEFLSDPRVIDIGTLAKWVLLNFVILPFRPKQTAEAYRTIWEPTGSPLLRHSYELTEAVSKSLGDDYLVVLGMRYGNPSLASAINTLKKAHCNKVIVIPLFPQYASAANGSAIEATLKLFAQEAYIPELHVIQQFYNEPGYIQSLAKTIGDDLNNAPVDSLVLSFHGLPERQIDKIEGNVEGCNRRDPCPAISAENHACYRAQCYATARAVAEALKITDGDYHVAFQSRLGRIPWIKPYFDDLLPELAKQGHKNIAVACPAFVADCLETLEEIAIRGQEQWQELGGENLRLIPCLNNAPVWVDALSTMIRSAT